MLQAHMKKETKNRKTKRPVTVDLYALNKLVHNV